MEYKKQKDVLLDRKEITTVDSYFQILYCTAYVYIVIAISPIWRQRYRKVVNPFCKNQDQGAALS